MRDSIVEVSADFWNIRGSFRIGGLFNVGTQTSLVRLGSGNFVFLDSYGLDEPLANKVAEIVGDAKVEAIINLHPFHTLHVGRMHALYPDAALYGTVRHLERFPDLPWQQVRSEDLELHQLFRNDFEFSIPEGVDFVSANENVHFSSVMAYHRASATIHVDDTLMYILLPRVLGLVGIRDSLGFHPTLAMALEKRPGAATDFTAWAQALIESWGDAENLCAAHSATLLGRSNQGAPIRTRLHKALKRCRAWLRTHELRYGR